MSAVTGMMVSGWHIILFLFSISLIIGTLGLYYGLKFRNKLKEITTIKTVKATDVGVMFLMIYYISKTMIFWFVEERFDWTPLDISWVVVDSYSNIGISFIIYIFMFIFIKLSQRRNKDDVNGEVQTPYIR